MKLRTLIECLLSQDNAKFNVYGNDDYLFDNFMYESGIVSDTLLDSPVKFFQMTYTGFYGINVYVYDPDKPVEGRPYYFYMDSCGDGVSTGSGWVKLTPEQARLVAFALDKSNWKDWVPGVPMVDGDTRIYLDKWKTVKQVEGKKK